MLEEFVRLPGRTSGGGGGRGGRGGGGGTGGGGGGYGGFGGGDFGGGLEWFLFVLVLAGAIWLGVYLHRASQAQQRAQFLASVPPPPSVPPSAYPPRPQCPALMHTPTMSVPPRPPAPPP
ncbi:hypothetical protein [Streptodolium elevatio]